MAEVSERAEGATYVDYACIYIYIYISLYRMARVTLEHRREETLAVTRYCYAPCRMVYGI